MRIYTFGYAGQSPVHLKAAAEALNAKVVDVRFSPLHRMPHAKWSKASLEKLLGDGYEWLKAFGNRDYQSGGIRILDPHAGNARIKELLDQQYERLVISELTGEPVEEQVPTWDALILVCACAEYMTCHRHEVAHLVEDVFGHEILGVPQELVETDVWKRTAQQQPQPPLIS